MNERVRPRHASAAARRAPLFVVRAMCAFFAICAAQWCGSAVHAVDAMNTNAPAAEIDWQTSPLDLDLRGMNGERYVFHCPSGKPQPSRVAGSGPYTDDSSICTAAVHAGVLHAKDGGDVAIEIRPSQDRYPGSENNYVKSVDYDRAWNGSFVVIRAGAIASHP